MMVTYDTIQAKYRVWRFETLPPIPSETTLRTEGRDVILEMTIEGRQPEIFYNQYSMVSKDRMKIVSEIHALDGKLTEHIGVSNATRIKEKL